MSRPKPRLIYSLSTNPPIAFPVHPTYPILQLVPPTENLPSAYLESLWNRTQSEQVGLSTFARWLLSLRRTGLENGEEQRHEPPCATAGREFETLLRSLVQPLHSFDKRWRVTIPDLVVDRDPRRRPGGRTSSPSSREVAAGLAQSAEGSFTSMEEADMILRDYDRWEVEERKRMEEDLAKERKAKGKEKARDQDRMDDRGEEDEQDAQVREDKGVQPDDWLSDREVYETRLQALLLLTILSLSRAPAPISPVPKKKGRGRQKKDPEREAATLDAALLLDFLTDRLQIWRVMQGLSGQDDLDEQDRNRNQVVDSRDSVQEWWADTVEPLYRNIVAPEILLHHRIKLFPDAPNESSSNPQAGYEERSLMSLDKSARRRDLRESQAIMAESPTMKRLMSFTSTTGGAGATETKVEETFKMPLPPRRSGSAIEQPPAEDVRDLTTRSQETDLTNRPRLPRKQERPRPLPRGDSATANMKDMLKRREVSLARKTSVTGIPKKQRGKSPEEQKQEIGRKRKRKSASPQNTLTLVPDTPAKPASKSASFKKPFSRAISLPSFAALGAAVRPGAPDARSTPLPFGIPPPPILPGDRMDEMNWSTVPDHNIPVPRRHDEDSWLLARTEDFHAKGGRSRDTSGSTEGEEERASSANKAQLDTPKKTQMLAAVVSCCNDARKRRSCS